MSEHAGGTVTYHRADWNPESQVWEVYFVAGGPWFPFSAEDGEAMGLTVPEPAPLVVECNGHRIELSDEQVDKFVLYWKMYDAAEGPTKQCSVKLAGLLRDARQDPQPTASVERRHCRWCHGPCLGDCWAAMPQPTADTPSDDIDFDALPDGTKLRHVRVPTAVRLKVEGAWMVWHSDGLLAPNAEFMEPGHWEVVYQPPALSPRQCLEALLAGRDDADRLIRRCADGMVPSAVLSALRDAARGGA